MFSWVLAFACSGRTVKLRRHQSGIFHITCTEGTLAGLEPALRLSPSFRLASWVFQTPPQRSTRIAG